MSNILHNDSKYIIWFEQSDLSALHIYYYLQPHWMYKQFYLAQRRLRIINIFDNDNPLNISN